MSIINLEKTFENGQLLYCNLDNKIIEFTCLSIPYQYDEEGYNKDLIIFTCYKVKVIAIYDIYKNIIYKPIQTNIFKNPIKIGTILENLIPNIWFFKTFIGAFIKNNKLNGIEHHINYVEPLYKFLYDNISLKIFNYTKTFNIYNNESKRIHKIKYEKNFIIYYKNYNDVIKYKICNNYIKIKKGKFPFYQKIRFYIKNLKIFKIYKHYRNIKIACEKRNDNNEIISLIEYDCINKLKEDFSSNNTNPPFSKPLKKICTELIDYYNKNINYYTELIKFLFKKEKEAYNNLLLGCKLEIINSK